MDYRIITTQQSLEDYLARVDRGSTLAIDTEFMRDRTYWPKLCLVQLAGPDDDGGVAISPRSVDDGALGGNSTDWPGGR